MTQRRFAIVAFLLLSLGGPLLLPFVDLPARDSASVWNEGPRLLGLARNTVPLVVGVELLALPIGIVLAVLLFRTDLPARSVPIFLVLLAAFVPLPLLVSGWEAFLGSRVGGLPAAIVLHALAGVPWVVLIVGIGLTRVERSLEEDALTVVPPLRVLWGVTLRRARWAVIAAALWLMIQTSSEIAVTDLYMVRTYAEEINTQLQRPEIDADATADVVVGRAVAVSLPLLVIMGAIIAVALRQGADGFPSLRASDSPLRFPLGRARLPLTILVAGAVGGLIGVPVVSLMWKAGSAGYPPAWSLGTVREHFERVLSTGTASLTQTVAAAVACGVLTTFLALVAAWAARDSAPMRRFLVGLALLAWTLPGPLVGLGLKQAIELILGIVDSDLLATLLYRGPSWLPVVWVQSIRLFPFALALLRPAVRLLPTPLLESARLDGASPEREFMQVVVPLTCRALMTTAAVMTALALGEIGASKLVSTPGAQSFAEHLFMQLHTGVSGDLAARCLLLLAASTLPALILVLARSRERS